MSAKTPATVKMIQNILDGTTAPQKAARAEKDGKENNIADTYAVKTVTTWAYADIAYYEQNHVYALIRMQRTGGKANIYIDCRCEFAYRPTTDPDVYNFISLNKVLEALGLNSINFVPQGTRVVIENLGSDVYGEVTELYAGYTGFFCELASERMSMAFARIYNAPPNAGQGGWGINIESLYTNSAVYHIDIFDADVT